MTTLLLSVPSYDSFPLAVRLCLPDNGNFKKIVIYINGSGPTTYTNKRQLPDGKLFNYFDIFAEEFVKRNIGFVSYSQRGCTISDTPPYFTDIDEAAYQSYLPHNSVADIENIVAYLKCEYPKVRIILLGWSEGAIIAPLVALAGKVSISALMLAGYGGENLRDTLIWQGSNSELLVWRRLFDYDRKGYISEVDFTEDRYQVRTAMFGDITFSSLDIDGDGMITSADTAPLSLPHMQNMLDAIERGDDEWLKNNHGIRLTSAWWMEHFSLRPTKEVLPLLDLPIHIFSGEYDFMTPMCQAVDTDKKFRQLGKTNLTLHTFKNHDHDLNIIKYVLQGEHSVGMRSIFDTVEELK